MVGSYLNGIKDLVGGDFREKEIYSIYGLPSVGKSLYMIEEAFNLLNNKYRVIWIDTEGGYNGLYETFKSKFESKYPNISPDNFYYKRCLTVEDLSQYLGIGMEIKYGDKITSSITKISTRDEGSIYETIGRKHGKFAIILDSFTSPLKLQFGTAVQNFGGRADAGGYIILGLMKLMDQTNAFTIMSNHSSVNPTNPYQQTGNMRGGNVVQYYSKFVIDFERQKKQVLADVRKLIAVRTPIAKNWDMFRWVKLTDNGYIDLSEEDVQNILNGN